jgi:hypothetical protein
MDFPDPSPPDEFAKYVDDITAALGDSFRDAQDRTHIAGGSATAPPNDWRPSEPAEKTPLREAAPRTAMPAEHESLKRGIEDVGKLIDDSGPFADADAKEAAARAIWKNAITRKLWKDGADDIARTITAANQARAYRAGLYDWLDDRLIDRTRSTPDEVRERRPLAAQFLDAMAELVKDLAGDVPMEVAKEMLIEMLFPGIHLVFPPTGLVDAILTACTLLEIAADT